MHTVQTHQPTKVLDKGFVQLIDIMPKQYKDETLRCDESIVRAARVSYNQESKGTERDSKLVKYLVEHKHLVPLESVVLQLQIKCPIFVQRHIVKHRMSSMNEVSARYTEVTDDWYNPQHIRKQSKINKQSSEEPEVKPEITQMFQDSHERSYNTYQKLLQLGVPKEQARIVLPQSMYTTLYLKMDLRNLLHFCNLRNAPDTQWETKQYAEAIENIIKETNPISWAAFRQK